jgi:tRNA A-37 threonylcarbamoyl transferase component Bud32
MATVYLARDQEHDRSVVVKVPRAELLRQPGFRRRFKREVRSLIALEHPNIVAVYDEGLHKGVPYAVMACLRGGSLGDRLKSQRQKAREILPWLTAIASALDFVARKGVVHRDVKPDNILFDNAGEACLSDFGISKAVGDGSTLTGEDIAPGTPEFMAPEQCRDDPVSSRTDQYALAATVYRALTGRATHDGTTPLSICYNKQRLDPEPLYKYVPRLSPSAGAAVMRALKRDPRERFPSCTEFAQAYRTGVLRMPASGFAPAGAEADTRTATSPPAAAPNLPVARPIQAPRADTPAPTPLPRPDAGRRREELYPLADVPEFVPRLRPTREAPPRPERVPTPEVARSPGRRWRAGWVMRSLWAGLVFAAVASAIAIIANPVLRGGEDAVAWAPRLDHALAAAAADDWEGALAHLATARTRDGATWIDIRGHPGMTESMYRRLRRASDETDGPGTQPGEEGSTDD